MDWDLPDPSGESLAIVRQIRDRISDLVRALIVELITSWPKAHLNGREAPIYKQTRGPSRRVSRTRFSRARRSPTGPPDRY